MLFTALRDMQWRKWRFVIAIIVTGLVFAMTLILTGLANGFRVEDERTVESLGVDVFLIKSGATGPFLGSAPFPQAELKMVAGEPGVVAAAPLTYKGATFKNGDSTHPAAMFGAPAYGPGMPAMSEGRAPESPDELAVSSTIGRRIGEELEVGSRKLLIVGIVNDSTSLAKTPNLFVTTGGVQQLEFGGQPLISSIGVRGTLSQVPDGYRVVNRTVAVDDLMRPTRIAVQAIRIVAILLWIVAALIVGGVVYLSALERMRDFAVFKAIGVATRSVLAGLVLQAIVVATLAAAFGAGLARLLAPLFPMNVIEPPAAYPLLAVIAGGVGVLASATAVRRAAAVDPAHAFGGP
ncbi:glutamine-transport transmembrane protein ABC transporter [Mycobacterium lentiflavum]|uniref:Glutamine-transport transmembrane protein ABC transporter n=1 Tax=Mycobacterium lentiflavum TaxID=141349 RepID=A0A0E4CMF9_MYCLN|nr:ABC transporter permease [Mycobacterium lentiflavum]CQD09558.1 glutamine-transport transmembrane protein ABC transporter [Mycobacterium lentiflavum]